MNARLADQIAALRLAAHQAVEDAVEAELAFLFAPEAPALERAIDIEGELRLLLKARALIIRHVSACSPTSVFGELHGPSALRRYERALREVRAERELAEKQLRRAKTKAAESKGVAR